MKRKTKKNSGGGRKFYAFLYHAFAVLAGSLLFAVGFNTFLLPQKIVLGGVTGISTILNLLLGTPVGVVIIAINIPLVIVTGIIYGWKFLSKTIIGILTTSILTDLITFFPITVSDPLLCAILGGATMGAGVGLLFSRGYTTGGTDLVAMLIKHKFKGLPTGKVVLFVDVIIIVGSAVITQNYTGIIYSIVAIYSYTTLLDIMLTGAIRAKIAFIISDKSDEIADRIIRDVDRGVTVLHGTGWYTKAEKKVLLCVVKKSEIYRVKTLIHTEDPEAFIIFADASEVLGSGFKNDSLA